MACRSANGGGVDFAVFGVGLGMLAAAWLTPDFAVLEDEAGRMSIEQAAAQLDGLAHASTDAQHGLNAGLSDSVWWMRIDLAAAANARLLVVPYSQNDQLEVFRRNLQGRWKIASAGDFTPMSSREIAHPQPIFAIEPDFAGPLYLRVASSGAVNVPLQLWDERAFWRQDGRNQLAYGFYYAVLFALAIYNAFLWLAFRDRAYLNYVLYLLGLLLFQVAYSGHGHWLLWPHAGLFAHLATLLGLAATLGFGAAFVSDMARARRWAPTLHKMLCGLMLVAVVAALLTPLTYRTAMLMLLLSVAVCSVVFPLTLVQALRAGERQARFLLLGYCAFMPGAALLSLRTAGFLPASWLSEHAYQIGTMAEAMLLSFALADRINLLNVEKERATHALAQQRERGAQALLDVQDAERRRIAQELHDGIGQRLLTILMSLRGMAAPEVRALQHEVRETIRETRRVSANLYPSQLDRLGLVEALQAMLETACDSARLRCTHDLHDVPLSRRDALQVYRIAQEAISNALRHAQARHVHLALQADQDHYRLRIEDDGHGFAEHAARCGQGIPGMHDRAMRLNACLSVQTRPQGGTQVTLEAPLT